MPQYFSRLILNPGVEIEITGNDYHHIINVRRCQAGHKVYIRDIEHRLFQASIVKILTDSILVKVLFELPGDKNPFDITLAVALLKGKKFELVIQKVVEIGVSTIIPLVTERAVPDISKKDHKKIERWRKIAEEAAKQSLQCGIAEIKEVVDFNQYIMQNENSLRIIAHTENSSQSLNRVIDNNFSNYEDNRIILMIGPEGGFSNNEISLALAQGWRSFHFGYSQLRAETAAIVFPALILNHLKEMISE